MNVAILTGGGDCPGLNAAIRAVTRRLAREPGSSVAGVRDGWRGLLEADVFPLNSDAVSGILHLGGTILGTSRTNPFRENDGPGIILNNMRQLGIDAVVAIGGEDTLGVANRMCQEYGMHVVGIPKTIDNDLSGTDCTIGFNTAINVASEAIDRLHSTAESHDRVMIAEVMGRHSGWIAVMAGIASGADVILIPEFPITVEEVAEHVLHRAARGKMFSIIVIAEGAKLKWRSGEEQIVLYSDKKDPFGHESLGGVGNVLAKEIERLTGFDTRVTILGHVQRGGTPTVRDRVLGSRFGIKAAELCLTSQWGMMASLRGEEIVSVPIAEAVAKRKEVPEELYEVAKVFFSAPSTSLVPPPRVTARG